MKAKKQRASSMSSSPFVEEAARLKSVPSSLLYLIQSEDPVSEQGKQPGVAGKSSASASAIPAKSLLPGSKIACAMQKKLGCPRLIEPQYLMCYSHWQLCPPHLQSALWSASKAGDEAAQRAVSKSCIEAVKEIAGGTAGPQLCPFCGNLGWNAQRNEYCKCKYGQNLLLQDVETDRRKKSGKKAPSFKPGEREYTAFPFGGHRDVPLRDVPTDYLHWFYTRCEEGKWKGLMASVEMELHRRQVEGR